MLSLKIYWLIDWLIDARLLLNALIQQKQIFKFSAKAGKGKWFVSRLSFILQVVQLLVAEILAGLKTEIYRRHPNIPQQIPRTPGRNSFWKFCFKYVFPKDSHHTNQGLGRMIKCEIVLDWEFKKKFYLIIWNTAACLYHFFSRPLLKPYSYVVSKIFQKM